MLPTMTTLVWFAFKVGSMIETYRKGIKKFISKTLSRPNTPFCEED